MSADSHKGNRPLPQAETVALLVKTQPEHLLVRPIFESLHKMLNGPISVNLLKHEIHTKTLHKKDNPKTKKNCFSRNPMFTSRDSTLINKQFQLATQGSRMHFYISSWPWSWHTISIFCHAFVSEHAVSSTTFCDLGLGNSGALRWSLFTLSVTLTI